MTAVARSVLMLRASVAATNTIHVLIALKIEIANEMQNDAKNQRNKTIFNEALMSIYLAAVFRKVDTSSEHSTDIRVSFIKAFLDNCLKENVFHRK